MMKLEQHLNHLPSHSLDDGMWANIESQLETKASLADRLPIHRANPNLWDGISSALSGQRSRLYLRLRYVSVAASIAVVMAVGGIRLAQQDEPYVYYSDELVIDKAEVKDVEVQKPDVLENCTEQPAVCTNPDFTRLKNSLDQLKHEEQKLRTLKSVSDDPKMDVYHARIVKNIQQVEAQMLHMFS